MSVEERKVGAIATVALALAIGGCMRTMSLGAAGGPDGGDARMSIDASDAPLDQPPEVAVVDATSNDTVPDAVVVADATQDDVPDDAHVDQIADAQTGQSCVDNGITYHSGDVVFRPGCQLSCVCADGVVGDCTGIPCPVDGSVIIDPAPVAFVTEGQFVTSPGVQVSIDSLGAAARTLGSATVVPPPLPRSFPPGAPEVTRFLYHLHRVGDLTKLPIAACEGSIDVVRVSLPDGTTSGDLRCLTDPSPDEQALAEDARVLLGIDDGNDSINARSCTTTGGVVGNNLCCAGSGNFPDTCAVGACSCAPTNVHVIDSCLCPTGSCFLPSIGCVGPANVCAVGANQTCNDDPTVNSIHGNCVTGGHCQCGTGFTLLASGKCS